MSIVFYDGKCDNCGKKTPGTFMQVWRHMSGTGGVKPQFWCFDCIHGRNFFEDIKKSVTFIFLEDDSRYVPNGTGFLVSVEVEKDTSTHVMYLVTAKHVIQKNNGVYHRVVAIRLNKHDGSSEYIRLDLEHTEIFTHTDNEVDLAGQVELS